MFAAVFMVVLGIAIVALYAIGLKRRPQEPPDTLPESNNYLSGSGDP